MDIQVGGDIDPLGVVQDKVASAGVGMGLHHLVVVGMALLHLQVVGGMALLLHLQVVGGKEVPRVEYFEAVRQDSIITQKIKIIFHQRT